MKFNGSLTLARILGPLPAPEFRWCTRCDNLLSPMRTGAICTDCITLYGFRGSKEHGYGFPPIDPAYEVSLHYEKHPKGSCPTVRTLDGLRVPYIIYTAQRDSIEVEWAKNLPSLGGTKGEWPIVLISAHGEVMDWWTGFDLFQLNIIPAARAAAINAQDQEVRVPTRELVAA